LLAALQAQHAEAQSALAAPDAGAAEQGPPPSAIPQVRAERKVGRNEPCPCGSGKKYKSCHGVLQA
jgi:preprotein translocase subunit SecA